VDQSPNSQAPVGNSELAPTTAATMWRKVSLRSANPALIFAITNANHIGKNRTFNNPEDPEFFLITGSSDPVASDTITPAVYVKTAEFPLSHRITARCHVE
jgi:hypothetical protein